MMKKDAPSAQTGPGMDSVRISVIIPFYNEHESLPALLAETLPVLDQFSPESELIFIDDGSTDGSSELLEEPAARDSRIKRVRFRKNFGQTAAWSAGIDHASGEILLFLDADLQNDPADIPMLVSRIVSEGYDVVSGWRRARKDAPLTRILPSFLANKLISWVTGVRLHDYGCSLKAYRAEMIKDIRLYGEMHRFLPAYVAGEGARMLEVEVNHRPRKHGKSKYGLGRAFKVLLDLLTVKFLGGFSTKPLYAFGALGGISLMLGMVSFSIVAYRVLILDRKDATPMVFLMVVFLIAGLQFIVMGLLAELAVRIYHEAQRKTVYRIRDLKNLPARKRRRLSSGFGNRP